MFELRDWFAQQSPSDRLAQYLFAIVAHGTTLGELLDYWNISGDRSGWVYRAMDSFTDADKARARDMVSVAAMFTCRAARREVMREGDIPTSLQPVRQIRTAAGMQYIYEINGKTYAVTQQTTDRVSGHGPHWELGEVKPPADYGLDPLGRLRIHNEGKIKINYDK